MSAKTKSTAAATVPGKAKSKKDLVARLSEVTDFHRSDITLVLDALVDEVRSELSKNGPGIFVLPGICRMKRLRKAATKERPARNPLTGEAITVAAKPARNVVRITPAKPLKDSI